MCVARPVLAFLLVAFATAFTFPAGEQEIPRPSKFVEIDYGTIDTYARNTPESATRNLRTLSAYLTSPARTDLAKARSVYTWITSHISYDMTAYSGRRYSSELEYTNRVLSNRKAVCTGFALLYKLLLKEAGIEVANIKGYSRTNDSEAGRPIRQMDHEWNAVKLDGDWYLVDIAWAQTTAKPGPSGTVQPNDFYFLTEPTAFVVNHFPLESNWQLLNKPFTKAQFDQFPKVYDAYFRLGFNPSFPQTGLLEADDDLSLTLKNEGDVEFMCSVSSVGGSRATNVPVQVQRTGDAYRLTLPTVPRGNNTLYVFAKRQGPRSERIKSFEGIAAFTVTK
ncbi:transglutaminase domain-containing protein [Spirosoma pomorum]